MYLEALSAQVESKINYKFRIKQFQKIEVGDLSL